MLRRRRISGLLDQAIRNRVTLVSGPAGAGKTVACATWAAAPPQARRVVWLSLDGEDQQAWFWAYVCAGLGRLRSIPAESLRSLEDASPDGFPLRLVEAAQTFTEPVILVLDDIHELTDQAVLGGIDLLIRHAPPTLRLVLSARQPPALQLARLRVSGELADIGGHDLACTSEEADAYFSMLGLDADPAARDALLRRTQGWMAGLRLAAMRARSDPEPGAAITDLAGDEPIVTDYLWDEVLVKQAPATRMFLLRTCIAAQVTGDLADALTGQSGSARTLDRLSRENSFVDVVDRERGEYAYHPLLRQVLIAELHREIPHEIPVLLRRAARWYAGHDQPIASVRCAAEAQDWDYAAQTLAEAGAGVASPGSTADLESVLSLFPAERSADDPAVAAAWAAARLWDGDRDGAAAYLDSGERALRRAVPAMQRIMEPTLAALRVMLAGGRTDPDPALLAGARSLAERAQAAASTQPEHRAVGLLWFAVGVARLRRWEIQQARHALRHADRQLAAGNLTGLQARARAWRALAEAWYGDLTAARRSAADVLAGRGVTDSGLAEARAGLGAWRAGWDPGTGLADPGWPDPGPREPPGPPPTRGARQAPTGPGRPRPPSSPPWPRRWSACAGTTCPRPSGCWSASTPADRPVPRGTVGERGRGPDPGPGPARGRRRHRGHRAAGQAARDVGTCPPGPRRRADHRRGRGGPAGRQHRPGPRGPAPRGGGRAFRPGRRAAAARRPADRRGRLQDRAGGGGAVPGRRGRRGDAAGADLRAADRRSGAAPSRVQRRGRGPAGAGAGAGRAGRRVPGLPGRGSRGPLGDDRADPADQPSRRLRRAHPGAFRRPGAPARRPADAVSVPLTDSERAVLRFLPSHMTNEEISQALFLSINTVKTHLRSAYRKLGVSSRREAIARGRRLGLL